MRLTAKILGKEIDYFGLGNFLDVTCCCFSSLEQYLVVDCEEGWTLNLNTQSKVNCGNYCTIRIVLGDTIKTGKNCVIDALGAFVELTCGDNCVLVIKDCKGKVIRKKSNYNEGHGIIKSDFETVFIKTGATFRII